MHGSFAAMLNETTTKIIHLESGYLWFRVGSLSWQCLPVCKYLSHNDISSSGISAGHLVKCTIRSTILAFIDFIVSPEFSSTKIKQLKLIRTNQTHDTSRGGTASQIHWTASLEPILNTDLLHNRPSKRFTSFQSILQYANLIGVVRQRTERQPQWRIEGLV